MVSIQFFAPARFHRRVAFMPFQPISLKALKPKESDFEPQTLGEHIKKRRLELNLNQRKVSSTLGVRIETLINWEKRRTTPLVYHLPAIRTFLGYDLIQITGGSIAEGLIAKRRQLGWTQRQLAEVLGVDPAALRDWEKGKIILYRKHRRIVARFVGISEEELEAEMSRRWGQVQDRRRGQ